MVAVTNGERCQKRSVYLGTEARSAAPRRDAGLGTPRLLGSGTTDKEHPSGNSPCAGEGLPCLNDPAVPLRPAPERQNLTKTFSKGKTPMKMFSVLFFLYDTHGFCHTQCFKESFKWETSSWISNHNLTMLHLILIARITLCASQSTLLSYGWWFLTAAYDFAQNLSFSGKVSFKVQLHGLVLWITKAKSNGLVGWWDSGEVHGSESH